MAQWVTTILVALTPPSRTQNFASHPRSPSTCPMPITAPPLAKIQPLESSLVHRDRVPIYWALTSCQSCTKHASCVISHLIFTTTLWIRYYYSHFRGAEIELQKGAEMCSRSHDARARTVTLVYFASSPVFSSSTLVCAVPPGWTRNRSLGRRLPLWI